MFQPKVTQAALPPLDVSVPVPRSGPVADYCRFYQLDLEQYDSSLHHACGWLSLAGYRVVVHVFVPQQAVATLWIVHGYLEHSGLYQQILPVVLAHKYAVVIYDAPGHGLSSGMRAGIYDFAEYQTVLKGIQQYLQPHLPQPWRALGQSMGGAVLMDYVLQTQSQQQPLVFDRIFLLAPLVLPTRWQWWQIRLGFWGVRAFRSGLPRVFRRNTSDEDFLYFMHHEDPLQARWLPLAWVLALKKWIDRIHRLPKTEFPVWLVQGGQDETVNNDYNLRFIRQRFHLSADLWLEQASHQLANERTDIRQPLETLLRHFLTCDLEHMRRL